VHEINRTNLYLEKESLWLAQIEVDGHDIVQLFRCMMEQTNSYKPTVSLHAPSKAKGSIHEKKLPGTRAAPNDEQLAQALKELGEEI
jgi:hypothetical protein